MYANVWQFSSRNIMTRWKSPIAPVDFFGSDLQLWTITLGSSWVIPVGSRNVIWNIGAATRRFALESWIGNVIQWPFANWLLTT
jgi:hypothetical protein